MRHKILLVEDNEINQAVVCGLLEDAPLDIDVADDGLIALDKLNRSADDARYALIIMDCQMPNMDGLEASKEIRNGRAGEYYKDIPILAVTANALKGDKEICLNAGMNDYLSKPIEPDALQEKLNFWLKSDFTLL